MNNILTLLENGAEMIKEARNCMEKTECYHNQQKFIEILDRAIQDIQIVSDSVRIEEILLKNPELENLIIN